MKVRRSNIATQGWRTLEYAGILIAKPQQDMNNGERLEKIGERDINIRVLKCLNYQWKSLLCVFLVFHCYCFDDCFTTKAGQLTLEWD